LVVGRGSSRRPLAGPLSASNLVSENPAGKMESREGSFKNTSPPVETPRQHHDRHKREKAVENGTGLRNFLLAKRKIKLKA
jgi:hypothetical protein